MTTGHAILRQSAGALLASAVFVLGGLPAGAQAQAGAADYPNRPIRMIVAFPPGGPTDIVSRVIAKRLGEQLGQTVVIENKPGAGGNIGAEAAAKAAPDGYTVFYNTSAITIAPGLYSKVGYDPVKDYATVSSTAAVPMVLMVNPRMPVKSVSEFIDYAKANPGKLNYGSTGSGTITHLATAAFAASAGLQLQHIPYKGSAPNIADLAAGVTHLTIDTLNSSLALIKDGRVRPLAVTTMRRSAISPELPTLNETAFPGMEMSAWQGIVMPAGTPPAIIEKLNAEVRKALKHPEVVEKLAAQGTDILGSTPQEYATYIRGELQRWSRLIRETGAKVD